MDLTDLLSATQTTGNHRDSSAEEASKNSGSVFSAYLDSFRETVKSSAQQAAEEAKNAEQERLRTLLRSLEPMLYAKIRKELLEERGLRREDVDAMTEEERISLEVEVYARVRDELVQRMGEDCNCHCDEGCNGVCEVERNKIRLYGASPFLIS